jgi:hypothetical protein
VGVERTAARAGKGWAQGDELRAVCADLHLQDWKAMAAHAMILDSNRCFAFGNQQPARASGAEASGCITADVAHSCSNHNQAHAPSLPPPPCTEMGQHARK